MKNSILLAVLFLCIACKSEPKKEPIPSTYDEVDGKIETSTPVKQDEGVALVEAPKTIAIPDLAACDDAILRVVQSSVRIKELMASVEKEGHTPAFIITKNEDQKGVYQIRLGVNLEDKFDTWTNFTLLTDEENLMEEDVVTGNNEPIDFDLKLFQALPKDCL